MATPRSIQNAAYNSARMILAAHGVTHAGRRAANEDALLVNPAIGLFVVADGMGGHRAGEVASRLAVETIQAAMAAGPRSGEGLLEAVQLANARIVEAAGQTEAHAGMGTTVTAALVHDETVALVSVGDSRVYRLRDGVLQLLTRDDSWLAHARSTGVEISDEDARLHPMRHVLTDVVGVRAELVPELESSDLRPGDTLLLCSDGLHGVMDESALAAVLLGVTDPAIAADRLVADAIERGTTDNVTAIVVRCENQAGPGFVTGF
jgi:PPM family protein phosphatase